MYESLGSFLKHSNSSCTVKTQPEIATGNRKYSYRHDIILHFILQEILDHWESKGYKEEQDPLVLSGLQGTEGCRGGRGTLAMRVPRDALGQKVPEG